LLAEKKKNITEVLRDQSSKTAMRPPSIVTQGETRKTSMKQVPLIFAASAWGVAWAKRRTDSSLALYPARQESPRYNKSNLQTPLTPTLQTFLHDSRIVQRCEGNLEILTCLMPSFIPHRRLRRWISLFLAVLALTAAYERIQTTVTERS
jgi:hypothetical protein